MHLAGAVVASWFLIQEVAGRDLSMTNIFVPEFDEFSENLRKNSTLSVFETDTYQIIIN